MGGRWLLEDDSLRGWVHDLLPVIKVIKRVCILARVEQVRA